MSVASEFKELIALLSNSPLRYANYYRWIWQPVMIFYQEEWVEGRVISACTGADGEGELHVAIAGGTIVLANLGSVRLKDIDAILSGEQKKLQSPAAKRGSSKTNTLPDYDFDQRQSPPMSQSRPMLSQSNVLE
jgi:hypothetical protein